MDQTQHPDSQPDKAPTPRRAMRFGYPLIIAGIVCIGALLVVQSSFSSGTYALEITEIRENPARYFGRDIRLVGNIKEGSVHTDSSGDALVLTFAVHDGQGNEVLVRYPHNPPDPFKEGRECIVEGTFNADGAVDCHKLTVKCPSKYQEEGGAGGASEDYYRKKYGEPAGGPTS